MKVKWNTTRVAFIAALFLACVLFAAAHDFGYGVEHGPQHWSEKYKSCAGKHQSPIRIDRLHVTKKNFPDIKYINFEADPTAIRITNNGHTVQVTITYQRGKEPRMKGGPLEPNAHYQFEQFHFHWGENDTVGSEDIIDNHRYPAEMHVVMRNLKYRDLPSALGQEYGVAVLAFFFKLEISLNPFYGEFVEQFQYIDQKGKSKELTEKLPLYYFLSRKSMNYYSYIGSLTTPPCTEKIIWIDYQEPITLANTQMEFFRKLTVNGEHLKNNYRPIQPLNNRTIYENIPNKERQDRGWNSFLDDDDFIESSCMNIILDFSLALLLMMFWAF